MTTTFHLNNREAKREINVYNNGKRLPFCPVPTYLEVKLDRSLTFCHHLEALRKKLTTRVALLRRLAGSGWGAGAKTLRTAALSLVYSTAEYCAPVWCGSAYTRLIDSVLNDTLRIVTGCLRPTPTDYLPVLAGIQPDELRRLGATLSLAYRGSLDPAIFSMNYRLGLQTATERDCLRAGVGCFQSFMHKWGLAPTSNFECGASEQTAEHIILTCPVHRAPTGIRGPTVLDVDTRCWLSTTTSSI